jgi:hypothetical protein
MKEEVLLCGYSNAVLDPGKNMTSSLPLFCFLREDNLLFEASAVLL